MHNVTRRRSVPKRSERARDMPSARSEHGLASAKFKLMILSLLLVLVLPVLLLLASSSTTGQ
eukprot:3933357-Rhodomonas_salina.4